MAVGVLSLLGRRVPPTLKLFLLALAIVDDIGAIVVIAVFYSSGIEPAALGVAAVLLVLVALARWAGVRHMAVYFALGLGLWLAVEESGVHATLVGVILGLMAPTRPVRQRQLIEEDVLTDLSSVEAAHETTVLARESVSVVEWLEHLLHPWTSFVILPLFALANAGIPLSSEALSDAASSPITLGVVLGLVVGKLVGVTAFTWLAARLGLGVLPAGATWRHTVGVAALAGIGFTVSIFITGLAFSDVARQNEAKVGILVASVLAAGLGSLILARAPFPTADDGTDSPAAVDAVRRSAL
jgi:NhaA family Na+:H+ antiporter